MGFFDRFRKKPAPPPPAKVEIAIPPEYAALIETTRVPYAAIHIGARTDDVRASKLGGLPYRPERGRYDELLARNATAFVAQIRCDELPELPGFPRAGLLQFWLGRKDMIEGVGERADGSVCLYYPSIDAPQLAGWSPAFDLEDTPLEDPELGLQVRLSAETEVMPVGDYLYPRLVGGGILATYPELRALDNERYDASGCKVGGYCAFTQDDPRSPDDPMLSLLQLDSEGPMMWGDSGIGHWFLREADLRALAFDKALFTWDCC